MNITVISPGPLSTVQDAGRFGYMNTGFSPGGAMDTYSMRIANLLVGNAPEDGVIEMTLMGMSVSFDGTSVIALTGADMSPKLNGAEIPMYTAVEVKNGDTLSLGFSTVGMRTYLAVAGGFDLPLVMGSMSTNLKCAIGGFNGRKLQAGDVIPLRHSISLSVIGRRSVTPKNDYKNEIKLRVILGPQDDYFTDSGIKDFLSSEYKVSGKSDRMGIRLEGEAVENKNGVDIISDGIATGSVQIPSSGTPIIMMADRQTTGGYAKIATVISSDLKLIAQARAGDRIKFEAVNEKTALKAIRKEKRELAFMQYRFNFAIYKEK
ncbi:MAG: biotin-dependent carboxyltransferase family protein [Ruminococcaceae bacterium]|nr:biotin-dependent carboxyltransferase family protein [Oscillospiraceae bacterium]